MNTESENSLEPIDLTKITGPEHRRESEILKNLEKLCASPGYAHALAFFCWRDNFIYYGEEFKPDDLEKMKSWNRLLRSELSFLIGLMVKAPINIRQPAANVTAQHIEETEKLMDELHNAMSAVLWDNFRHSLEPHTNDHSARGRALREPIFYGSESAYMFQYKDFSPEKYRGDADWIRKHKGFTPNEVKEVIDVLDEMQATKIRTIHSQCTHENINSLTLLPAFTFTKHQIEEKAGRELPNLDNVLKAFSPRAIPCNQSFSEIGSFNEMNSYPIIPLDDDRYILFQTYSLAESSYETPFFWMLHDEIHAEKAKENRGMFTERFSAERLKSVLGAERVYTNVEIWKGKNRVGEIDVLAVYADRAIVLQAKSKKLTEAARKGNTEALEADFQKAIQHSYDQAFKCAQVLGNKACCLTDDDGQSINLRRDFAQIFIFCVVSEYYPALAHQADQFLKKHNHKIIQPPYVMDVFFLDVLCELLDKPVYFFSFLHRRANYASKVRSEIELAVLSFHLAHNLWFEEEQCDFVDLEDDFSVHVDAAMFSRRVGLPGDKIPKGILTKLQGSFFDLIIKKISTVEQDDVIDFGYFLLDLSEKSAEELSKACELVLDLTRQDGAVHDFTMAFGNKGITVHSRYFADEAAYKRFQAHCEIAKYRQKAESWFGLLLNPSCDGFIESIIGLDFPWKRSQQFDHFIENYTRPLQKNVGVTQVFRRHMSQAKRKIGRNEPCPCGSGKKYKKCCFGKKVNKNAPG